MRVHVLKLNYCFGNATIQTNIIENDIIVVFDDSIHFLSIFIDFGEGLVQYNRMVLQASTSVQVFQRVFSETRDTR